MQQIPEFYLASPPGERTSLCGDEVIDMELQVDPPGASFMLGNAVKSFSDHMLASVGLMRLHSAPSSSMLANAVDTVGDDFVSTGSSPLAAHTAVDAEFARLFPDDIACPAARFESEGFFPLPAKAGALSNGGRGVEKSAVEAEQRLGDRSRLISQHSLFNRAAANGLVDDASRVTLPAILEQGAEVSSENFYGNSQIPLSLCRQQGACAVVNLVSGSGLPCYTSLPESETNLVRHRSSPAGFVSGSGMPCYSSLPESENNLVRHRSSPAGLVSRLATEAQSEISERPKPSFAGSMRPSPSDCLPERATTTRTTASVSPVHMGSSFELGLGPGMNSNDLGVSSATKSGLLRHSSSPAGLLSQLNLDGLVDAEKLMLFSSSGNSSEEGSFDKRGGLPFLPNFPSWDESVAAPGRIRDESPNGSSSAARKRIREIKSFAGSTSTDPRHGDALEHGASANYFRLPTAFTPETPFCPDKLPPDSVLCRARAKRGCATHPRSIAERVRRTKISERMRNLQELVPNMDKQTNTADMLDEAVEYVKLLQQQVQELTEKQPKCDGSCKQKTPSSK